MIFDIEIIIRTHPEKSTRTELVETATVAVDANNYDEAVERTFRALKSCDTFRDFMDKVCFGELKYGENQS
jgi:hypothetical protein